MDIKNPSLTQRPILGAMALNVEYSRKYRFHASMASRVSAKIVAVPAPLPYLAFIEAARAQLTQSIDSV